MTALLKEVVSRGFSEIEIAAVSFITERQLPILWVEEINYLARRIEELKLWDPEDPVKRLVDYCR